MDKYWSERAEQSMKRGEVSAEKMLTTMLKEYDATKRLITKEIESFIGRYATASGLTIMEVRKLLTKEEFNDFQKILKEYSKLVSKIGNKDTSNYYKAKVERLLIRKNISRLQSIEASIDSYIVELGVKEQEALSSIMGTVYEDTYYRAMYDLDKFIGYGVPVNGVSKYKLDTVLKEQWAGSNYSDRIWQNKTKLTEQLNTTFLRGVIANRDSTQIAKEMSKNLGVSFFNCKRLVFTETAHIIETATLNSYRDVGVVKKYQILATLDLKTSEICQEMDRKIFNVSEAVEGINYPPFHPFCRTTTVPYIDDAIIESTRYARDKYGRGMQVPASMTYKEWYKTFIEK